jgi:hypothetical protein
MYAVSFVTSLWCNQNICYSWWELPLDDHNHQDLGPITLNELAVAIIFHESTFSVSGKLFVFCLKFTNAFCEHYFYCSWCINWSPLFQELEEKRKQKAQISYERRKQLTKLRVKAEKSADERLGSQLEILAPIKYWEACAFVLYHFCGTSAAVFYSSLVCDITIIRWVVNYLRIF